MLCGINRPDRKRRENVATEGDRHGEDMVSGVLVTFLAIAAAIMWTAQPVAMAAGKTRIDWSSMRRMAESETDGDCVRFRHDECVAMVRMDSLREKSMDVSLTSSVVSFPITLGKHTNKIAGNPPRTG